MKFTPFEKFLNDPESTVKEPTATTSKKFVQKLDFNKSTSLSNVKVSNSKMSLNLDCSNEGTSINSMKFDTFKKPDTKTAVHGETIKVDLAASDPMAVSSSRSSAASTAVVSLSSVSTTKLGGITPASKTSRMSLSPVNASSSLSSGNIRKRSEEKTVKQSSSKVDREKMRQLKEEKQAAAEAKPVVSKDSSVTSDSEEDEAKSASKKVTCNCKKSKCLKLYCDCFALGRVCGEDCNCVGCHNTPQHEDVRRQAIDATLERNPNAFKPKVEKSTQQDLAHSKGCNCKKSQCLKKYCECFQAGVKCSDLCKCENCKNTDCSHSRKKEMTKSITKKLHYDNFDNESSHTRSKHDISPRRFREPGHTSKTSQSSKSSHKRQKLRITDTPDFSEPIESYNDDTTSTKRTPNSVKMTSSSGHKSTHSHRRDTCSSDDVTMTPSVSVSNHQEFTPSPMKMPADLNGDRGDVSMKEVGNGIKETKEFSLKTGGSSGSGGFGYDSTGPGCRSSSRNWEESEDNEPTSFKLRKSLDFKT